MTLRDVVYEGDRKGLVMVECPCGYEFDDGEERKWHFLNDHQPEDFGLSPKQTGQTSMTIHKEEGVRP